MQIVFKTTSDPYSYSVENGTAGVYPSAPETCPLQECGSKEPMVKHGFYVRWVICLQFCGRIRVRRYRCKACGRTVSMLPSFCIPQFTYSLEVIIHLLGWVLEGKGVTGTMRLALQKASGAASYMGSKGAAALCITQRHIRFYRARFLSNAGWIAARIKQAPPWQNTAEAPVQALDLIREIEKMHPHVFHSDFHRKGNKAFLNCNSMVT